MTCTLIVFKNNYNKVYSAKSFKTLEEINFSQNMNNNTNKNMKVYFKELSNSKESLSSKNNFEENYSSIYEKNQGDDIIFENDDLEDELFYKNKMKSI